MRSDTTLRATATLQEDFDLSYLQMQYTLKQMGRSNTDAFDAVPTMIPGKMLTLAYIQAKEHLRKLCTPWK
jgi:hypothetical protein